MSLQQNWSTIVGYFRSSRKCFSFNGSLLFLLVLVLAIATPQALNANPIEDVDLPHDFNMDEEFRDVDNLEIHRVKLVNGVMEEDHPIIVYKEDFVNEDYVPPKNETKSEKHKRRYKDISHRRRHAKQNLTDVIIEEKPEKMLFDIIPEKPIIVAEDMEKPRRDFIKLVPLIDDLSENQESEIKESSFTKDELNKRPKKFHRRVRREANGEHIVRKRNPYYRHLPKVAGEVPNQVQYIYVKHSVAGKKHNGLDIYIPGPAKPAPPTRGPTEPISFDNRVAADENDRVIFSGGSNRRTTPRPTPRPTESIFRDPRPENFDYSFMNPPTTRRPQAAASAPESIFRDPRPENFDFGFMNRRPQTTQAPASARPQAAQPAPAPASQSGGISQCVWAIVNCCSNRNSDIRYSCFEQNGCYGAFWGLNPCADNVRENFVNYVADYYN